MDNKNKKINAKTIIVTVVIIALVSTVVVMGYVLWRNMDKFSENVEKERMVSGGLVLNKTRDELTQQNNDSMFTTDMNMLWDFESGTQASYDAYIGNSQNNSRDVYFDVILADDPEKGVIYSSPIMPVGTHLEELKLDKVLSKGEYPAICTFYLLDDNQKEISKVSFSVTINILN